MSLHTRRNSTTARVHVRRAAVTAFALITSSAFCGAAQAAPSGSITHTPNSCIRLNGGDFNACNVGNDGRGDLPYRPVR